MSRFRPRHRGALIIGAVLLTFVPLATGASAATPPPPQDTSAFCANATTTDPFTDTDPSSVHHANILCLVSAGITQGTTATTYSPANVVTRAQMATFIARAIDEANSLAAPGANLNVLPPYDGVNQFVDVSNSDTHVGNINRLAKAGIVHGKTAATYDPTGQVTRGQMASFINRAEEFLTGTAYSSSQDFFTDDDGNTHEANINAIASVGIANGVSGTSYAPDQGVRRDQMASFLIRWLAVENAAGNIGVLPSGGPSLASAAVTDADQDGTLSNGDHLTLTFTNPVAATSSLTLEDADGTIVVLTDDTPHPAGETPATFALDATKKILTVTITGPVLATGGNGILNGSVTITGASGITDESSGTAWDPSTDDQTKVVFTIPAGTAQQGPVTFVDKAHDTYRFVPVGANAEVTVVYTSGDSFTDDGASATMDKFETDLSVGDVIRYLNNTPTAGKQTHQLTNRSTASYTSGTVGDIDTNAAPIDPSAHTLYIIEPVSGIELSDAKDYTSNAVWTVDGATATQPQFEAALSEGDQLVITAGSGNTPTTFALTNRSVAGTVSFVDTTNKLLMIGNLGDDPTSSQNASYKWDLATSTYTVNGATATLNDFQSNLTVGDSLTYARAAGTQTFALVNQTRPPVTGTVTETHSGGQNSSDGGTVTVVNGATRTDITYTSTAHFFVDGQSATEANFESKVTAGDSVTYQQGDAGTNTPESITLTDSFWNGSASTTATVGCAAPSTGTAATECATGHMRDIHGQGTTYDIVNDQAGIVFDNLNYVVPTTSDFGQNQALYFVRHPNDTSFTSLTLPQWEQYLQAISGANNPLADITVIGKSGSIEHYLVTSVTV